MKTCPWCGKPSQNNYEFCPACGSPLKSEPNQSRLKNHMGISRHSSDIPTKQDHMYMAPETMKSTGSKSTNSCKSMDLSSTINRIRNNEQSSYIIAAIGVFLIIVGIILLVLATGNYSVNEASVNEAMTSRIIWELFDSYYG